MADTDRVVIVRGGGKGFAQDITIGHHHGALSAEQRARLFEIGQRCPVHRTLTSGIQVTAVQV